MANFRTTIIRICFGFGESWRLVGNASACQSQKVKNVFYYKISIDFDIASERHILDNNKLCESLLLENILVSDIMN